MANTVTELQSNQVIQITYAGTGADWLYSTNHPLGLKVKSIFWLPSTINDVLVINEGTIDGPSIVHAIADIDILMLPFYFGNGTHLHPCIDVTDCTFGTAANTKITFILAP